MRKALLIISILFLTSLGAFAGNNKATSIKGKVVDIEGSPILGAKVSIKGVDSATYTDFDGAFYFYKVPKVPSTINVSMISFEEKKSAFKFDGKSSDSILSITLIDK